MVEGHYNPALFNPIRQPPDFSNPNFSNMNLGLISPGLKYPVLKKKDPIKLKDILTMNLTTPSLNQGLFIP